MIIATTGHRPTELGGFGDQARHKLSDFAVKVLSQWADAQGLRVISGMALGWDQAIVEACIDMEIPYTAALPFKSMGINWPKESRSRLEYMLDKAHEVLIVSSGSPGSWAFLRRNEWMINEATKSEDSFCLALWSGVCKGGTYYTVEFAKEVSLHVENVWDDWIEYKAWSFYILPHTE